MKRLFAGAIGLLILLTTPVYAGDWYAGGYGGLSLAEDFGTTIGPVVVNSNTDTGYVVGGFVGKHIPSIPGLSVEADLSYRTQDFALTATNGGPPLLTVPGSDSTIAVLLNARYDVIQGGRLTPYVYAGAGYGERTVEFQLIPLLFDLETTRTDLVWQAGAGVDYALTEDVSAGIRYTYFNGVDAGGSIGPVVVSADGSSHNVSAVLTFALN